MSCSWEIHLENQAEDQVTGADVTFTHTSQLEHRLMAAGRTEVIGQHTQQLEGERQREHEKLSSLLAQKDERRQGCARVWSCVRLWEW